MQACDAESQIVAVGAKTCRDSSAGGENQSLLSADWILTVDQSSAVVDYCSLLVETNNGEVVICSTQVLRVDRSSLITCGV